MRRGTVILIIGGLAGLLAFTAVYFAGAAAVRSLCHSPQPEMAWLKQEYKLSDAEFARIQSLHDAYLPECSERCRRIQQLNDKLDTLLATTTNVTPEINSLLHDRAQIRAECQSSMLVHFLAVSREMPPQEAHRYLEWVTQNTCLNEQPMAHATCPAP